MRILALDTSGVPGSLAALEAHEEGVELRASVELPEGQRTAQSLLITLQRTLQELGWQPTDLQLICVTTGPGSFTGLRIGVTTAKTLAYAVEAELAEVHTLAAIAAGMPSIDKRLWTVLDAQRQQLFVAEFNHDWQSDGGNVQATEILLIDRWLERLEPGDQVCGPPLGKLQGRLPEGVAVVDASQWAPRAEVVGRLGYRAFLEGRCVDPMQLVPKYYRKSAAEEKAERGK